MIWREKQVLLIILGVLLLANIGFFMTYRVRYQQRLDDLDARVMAAQAKRDAAQARSRGLEGQFAAYQKVQRDIDTVYNEHWATQRERMADLLVEVRKLAAASQLVPKSTAFMEEPSKKEHERTTQMGITFGVQGSYQQVRRLINLLELSDQFIIIDQLGLQNAVATSDSPVLSLTIRLKTIFRIDPADLPKTPSVAGSIAAPAAAGQEM
jgi:Tfp pilus assembly protein PilO